VSRILTRGVFFLEGFSPFGILPKSPSFSEVARSDELRWECEWSDSAVSALGTLGAAFKHRMSRHGEHRKDPQNSNSMFI
jgi:hypothetical protein